MHDPKTILSIARRMTRLYGDKAEREAERRAERASVIHLSAASYWEQIASAIRLMDNPTS